MGHGYDFTPLYKHSYTVPSYNGLYTLTSLSHRLILRSTSTLQILRSWNCSTQPTKRTSAKEANDAVISSIAWSPLDSHVLAVSESKGVVLVFDVEQEDGPVVSIEIGGEGLAKGDAVRWMTDGSSVMIWSNFGLRLSVLRLDVSPPETIIIQYPKHGPEAGWSIRPTESKVLALIERRKSKDLIGIYDCSSWRLVRHFLVATSDAAGIAWSPCGRYLAVWDSPLEYILHIYTPMGALIATYSPYTVQPTTDILLTLKTSSLKKSHWGSQSKTTGNRDSNVLMGLGIRSVEWHPTGKFVAIAGYDQKIRVLNNISWTNVALLDHPAKIITPVKVWVEPYQWIEKTLGRSIVQFDQPVLPFICVSTRPEPTKQNPRVGVSLIAWSPDGKWLASRNDNTPNAVYIFSVSLSSHGLESSLFTVLHLTNRVRGFSWSPTSMSLAISCNTAATVVWRIVDEESVQTFAEGVGVPVPQDVTFGLENAQWTREENLLLSSKDCFCWMFNTRNGSSGAMDKI